jgi:nitroreductase
MTAKPLSRFAERLSQRYGDGDSPKDALPHSVIDLMLNHRSVRSYKPDPLPEGALASLVAAAQSAATSSNLQTWSVVSVEDRPARRRCAEMAGGQMHIEECPTFLLFVADLARLANVAEGAGIPAEGLNYFEMLLMAAIDASLAAQNFVVAAESLGLSTVYIGGMRNKPEELAELIGLPPMTTVVFGLCVGYAAEGREGSIKPRLPQEAVLYVDRYDLAAQRGAIARYDQTMAEFQQREGMKSRSGWTKHSARRIESPAELTGRHDLMNALRRMGFLAAES